MNLSETEHRTGTTKMTKQQGVIRNKQIHLETKVCVDCQASVSRLLADPGTAGGTVSELEDVTKDVT